MYLELQAKYEIFLSELPVVGKDLHLLDGIAIGNINLISDTTGTVLNLDIADRHIRLTLSDNQEQCQMLCTKGIYTGYDAGQEKMQFLWFRMEQRFSCFTIHRLGVGFDGTAIHMGHTPECSTIVQPIPLLAETCVDILLKEDRSDLPSLICLPVSYAYGGTTRDGV